METRSRLSWGVRLTRWQLCHSLHARLTSYWMTFVYGSASACRHLTERNVVTARRRTPAHSLMQCSVPRALTPRPPICTSIGRLGPALRARSSRQWATVTPNVRCSRRAPAGLTDEWLASGIAMATIPSVDGSARSRTRALAPNSDLANIPSLASPTCNYSGLPT